MAKDKKSIVLYTELIDTFEMLSDADAGQLVKHLFRYVNDLNPESENPIVNIAFVHIKNQLKRDLKKWENTINGRSKAGKASAEARKIQQNSTKSTNVPFVQQDSTKPTVNVNVNVNDNVNVKENKSIGKKVFLPPPENLIIEYFIERGANRVEAGKYSNHYNANGWKVGRNKMVDWKAAARNWISNKDKFTTNGKTKGQLNDEALEHFGKFTRQAAD